MKKQIILSVALLAASSAVFLSCKKNKDTNSGQLSELGKATVSGRADGNIIDTIGATGLESVPAGTVVRAWIDTKDLVLNSNSSQQYAKKYYSGTVDANGNYSITVDVSKNRSATLHIEPGNFECSVMKNMYIGGKDSIYYVRRVLTGPSSTVEVFSDLHLIKDIVFY